MARQVRVQFELPENLVPKVSDAELSERMKQDLVLRLFREGTVSSGAAAEALGVTRRGFMALVAERGLPYFDLDEADLVDELDAGIKLARSTAAH